MRACWCEKEALISHLVRRKQRRKTDSVLLLLLHCLIISLSIYSSSMHALTMRRAAYIRFTVYSADPRIKRGGKTALPVGQ